MCPPYVLSILAVLMVTGYVGALTISAVQPEVTGYEKDSIVLGMSYQTSNKVAWRQIRWNIVYPKSVHLIICTIRSENISDHIMFPENGYDSRMIIDPESGSLKIKHLKMEDGGTYNVSILDNQHEKWALINVTVLTAGTEGSVRAAITEGPCICSGNGSSVNVPTSAWILLSSRVSSVFISLLVLLVIHWRNRNRSRSRTLRTLPSNLQRW